MDPVWLPLSLIVAFGLDLLTGDPRVFSHPVVVIGRTARFLEQLLRRCFKGPRQEIISGALLVILSAGGFSALTLVTVSTACKLQPFLGFVLCTYILYTMIAVGDMVKHIENVVAALTEGSIELARHRVSLLVSRDTSVLDEEGIIRAALESLFENTSDGVVAPLFYAALGGPALVVLYKSVNTLDSMVGYKNRRYYYFGRAAARCDDFLSFIPARLTAFMFLLAGILTGYPWKRGLAALRRDRKKHESPNSAWPEAAAAGLLGIHLGGPVSYHGVMIKRPFLNEQGRPPRRKDLIEGLALFRRASCLALGGALLLMYILQEITGVFS